MSDHFKRTGRTEQVTIYLTVEQRDQLRALADNKNAYMSAIVYDLVATVLSWAPAPAVLRKAKTAPKASLE